VSRSQLAHKTRVVLMKSRFNDGLKTSLSDSWTTPRSTYDVLDREFHFALDAAALQASTLVPENWYGPDHPEPSRQDALTRSWLDDCNGGTVWLNPPYGRAIKSFMAKANQEAQGGSRSLLLSQHVLTLNGGGIASSITRLDLLRAGLSLEIRPTLRHSHQQ
jgi:hypothetical protein